MKNRRKEEGKEKGRKQDGKKISTKGRYIFTVLAKGNVLQSVGCLGMKDLLIDKEK